MSEKSESLVSSSFGNGYVTNLDAEIKDYMFTRQKVSRLELIEILKQTGYRTKDIVEELDRQCYASTLRYIPSEDAYAGIKIGRLFWSDILQRIHDQGAMVGGKLQTKGPDMKLDIFRTDFQSLKFKNLVKHLGLRQAPVMRWTKHFKREEGLSCLNLLLDATPRAAESQRADLPYILEVIREVNRKKSRKTTWIWMTSYIEVVLEFTFVQKSVMETVFQLGEKPVDWNGKVVSLERIQECMNITQQQIEESLECLEHTGIVRKVGGGVTPTGQGYFLIQYAQRPHPLITFAAVHRDADRYRLEISTRYQDFGIREFLREQGCKISPQWKTLVEFGGCTQSEIIHVLDSLMESGLLWTDR